MGTFRLVLLAAPLVLLACGERTRTRQVQDAGLECGDNERLINGECVFVCDRDVDCAAGERCNLLLGTCEAAPPEDDAGVQSVPCTTGATRCRADSKAVEICSEAGLWMDQEVCANGGFCLNETCLACQPGATSCDPADATKLTVCLDDGSATRSVQCQAGGACVQGECRECAPNTTRCSPDGKNVQTCQRTSDETLTWRWVNSGDNFDGTCITQQCIPNSPAVCKAPDCIPGAAQCVNSGTLQTCSQTGSWTQQSCTTLAGPAAECLGNACVDQCAEAVKQKSYFGCEYWTAVQDNSVDPIFKGGTTSGQGTADSEFAFVIANRSDLSATVTIQRSVNGTVQTLKTVTVDGKTAASKGLSVIHVPWQSIGASSMPVGVSATGLARYGYRITSTRPVTVYQFSPLNALKKGTKFNSGEFCTANADCRLVAGGQCVGFLFKTCEYPDTPSYSNDASLLLPAHILGTQYVVLSHQHMSFSSGPNNAPSGKGTGHMTLVATQAGTQVTIKSSAVTASGGSVPALSKGQTYTVTLEPYDVLQLATDNLPSSPYYIECAQNPFGGSGVLCRVDNDLTGTVVTSTKPVAVFGGAACAVMPNTVAACDHVEEQVFPFSTWGKTFAAHKSHPVRLTSGQFASTSQMAPDYYKVVASCSTTATNTPCPNGTLITFSTPPAATDVLAPNRCLSGTIAGNNCRLAGGSYMEFRSKSSFTVTGDQPIALAQLFPGQGHTSGGPEQGDPSIILLPPAEQWRSEYTVQAAPGLRDNYLGIVFDEANTSGIEVDGMAIPASSFITVPGTTTYKAINHPVSVGVHTIRALPKTGANAVPKAGVTVYGFDVFVSYGYTGGLDLNNIVTGINPGG